MKKLDVIAFESFRLGKGQTSISAPLREKLYTFLAKSYHLINQNEFMQLVIQAKEKGELVVLYGAKNDIAGFCRIFIQKLTVANKEITVYVASLYFNPSYNTFTSSASLGLTQGIKHKLKQPNEEIIYVAIANNPLSYELFYQLIESMYPKPEQQVPDQIIKVLELLKERNGWITTGNHPMVISSTLVPIRSYNLDSYQELTDLNDFYISINPDYMQGNSLLVYIPLHLANIHYGLNSPQAKSYQLNPPHQLYPEQGDCTGASPY